MGLLKRLSRRNVFKNGSNHTSSSSPSPSLLVSPTPALMSRSMHRQKKRHSDGYIPETVMTPIRHTVKGSRDAMPRRASSHHTCSSCVCDTPRKDPVVPLTPRTPARRADDTDDVDSSGLVHLRLRGIPDGCKGCSICFELFEVRDTVTYLPCGHMYHSSCLLYELKRHGCCPTCETALPSNVAEETEMEDRWNASITAATEGSPSSTPSVVNIESQPPILPDLDVSTSSFSD